MQSEIKITELSEQRFNALAAHSRSPAAAYVSKELGWFANDDESVIGVLLLDTVDDDFVAVVMARDEHGAYRAIDVESSIKSEKEALEWLHGAMKWHTGTGKKVFPQGGAGQGIDLFTPVVPVAKQHPYFTRLANEESFLPAKNIINEMMPHFVDIDGNFVEQFQSTGFDSRLWELYINSYLVEEQLFIDRSKNAPDFLITKYGETVAIEAVVVGRKKDNPVSLFRGPSGPNSLDEIREQHKHAMPLRFGSPLYSKLTKKYWELPHVVGNPLVFAIADFHDDQSMLWSSTALETYLYGVRHEHHYENGQLVIDPIKIDKHIKPDGTEISSGFFFQPDAEYVSAILFSASGTISKFNRLGRQAGFGSPNVRMFRIGTCYDHDPNASVPRIFKYEVTENSQETWGEGISMFHNPNAIHPVPIELFPSIAHHRFENDQIVSILPEFHPFASQTMHIRLTK
ncbi:MAG: glycosaminoglycan attachment protein [Gammaproteobacteria bacterium]|nr:MAG: glycosaminoglycan attachment protein [Gammaproteobacteria bacterium]